jgi:hypothetical protein
MSNITPLQYAFLKLREEIELADSVTSSVAVFRFYSCHFYTPTSQVFLGLF